MKSLQTAIRLIKNIQSPSTKLAIIVRTDLKMSKGKIAAQCAHAAVLCVQEAQTCIDSQTHQVLKSWLIKGQPKIVLKADGYEDLLNLRGEAIKQQVISSLVQDAGHTQLAAGTATVLGIGPDTAEKIDKLVGHLKLL